MDQILQFSDNDLVAVVDNKVSNIINNIDTMNKKEIKDDLKRLKTLVNKYK
jgi:hypothetical protein